MGNLFSKILGLRGRLPIIPLGSCVVIVETQKNNFQIFFLIQTGSTTGIVYPLSGSQKLTILRNVEKMIGEAVGDPAEVAEFMQTMVLGRYTDLAWIEV